MAALLALAALLHHTRRTMPSLGRWLALGVSGLLVLFLAWSILHGDLLRPAAYSPDTEGCGGARVC